MRRVIPAVLLIIAACNPQQADPTTTTQPDTTTSTKVTTTTSLPVTTTSEATTTTTKATTTTTIPPTTATTELAGSWADQPLIIARMGALGWWDGSQWVVAKDEGALPIVGGESYQVARIGIDAIVTGESQILLCEPFINNLGVNVDDPDLLGDWPGPAGVAISAPWELQPHLFQAFDDDGTYSAFAGTLLANRGLVVAKPVIKQLFRTDLEGDGINEVLVVAESFTQGFIPVAGDYSIAFLRKVVQGEAQTAVLGDSIVINPEGAWLLGYTIGAVADLNGDGKMEIVLDTADLEGFGIAIWEYANDDLGPIQIMQTGCGA